MKKILLSGIDGFWDAIRNGKEMTIAFTLPVTHWIAILAILMVCIGQSL